MQYNLTKPPIIERVSNTQEALARLAEAKFDLVISLMRVEGEALNIVPFINNIRGARARACVRARSCACRMRPSLWPSRAYGHSNKRNLPPPPPP